MPRAIVGRFEIEFQITGSLTGKPLLLLMGQGTPLVFWEDSFCSDLATAGFRVIRFDYRDVGRSTDVRVSVPGSIPETLSAFASGALRPPYSLDDLAADAVGLLDGLQIQAAHLVGISMGGMVGQIVALRYPRRALSLTSISSTTGDPGLPGPSPELMTSLLQPLPTSRDEFIRWQIDIYARTGSPVRRPLEHWLRARAERFWDHGWRPSAFLRNLLAVVSAADRTNSLRSLDLPTLVVHGDADPMIPPAAAHATAAAIPGARLLVVPGMGHDLAPEFLPAVAGAIVDMASQPPS
jgi:pimeloyl-ACP methyl ester carboxylesterase